VLKTLYSVGNEKTYTIVVVIAILIACIAYAVSLFTWCRGYYTYKDMFGPSLKHVAIGISIVLFLLVSFLYFLHFSSSRRSNSGGNSILPIIALVLVITTIRLLPDVADSYYS
jgi:heme/copper-type cytochrome/quinol oxidase subunit 4